MMNSLCTLHNMPTPIPVYANMGISYPNNRNYSPGYAIEWRSCIALCISKFVSSDTPVRYYSIPNIHLINCQSFATFLLLVIINHPKQIIFTSCHMQRAVLFENVTWENGFGTAPVAMGVRVLRAMQKVRLGLYREESHLHSLHPFSALHFLG